MQDLIAIAKAEFEGSAALRAEFTDLKTYTAYRKVEAAGRVWVLGNRSHERPAAPTARSEGGDVVAIARAEFERDAALRAEFTDLATYTAFRKAQAAGRVRVLGEHRESLTEERVAPSMGHAVAVLAARDLDRIATRRFGGAASLPAGRLKADPSFVG